MTATDSQHSANGHTTNGHTTNGHTTSGNTASGHSHTPSTPEALRAEITRTRAGLGETVEALAAKADVKARAQEAVHTTVENAKDRVSSGVEAAKLRVREGAEQVAVNAAYAGRELRTHPRTALQSGMRRLLDSAREHPAPWIVGSALLVLAGLVGYRSRQETM
ncbi:DUF3618 domain-containing protein [Dactylosporangium vinaceum]|uniref:DUF3618 domain-containing protein n=1 Tax=Dactylosporangium vinaceum TaxID=53362 RepID=A0ABV5MB66_9ACTN|nr:DUF3618 domain-containing protein [Dactylosporangium vinaceum]